MAQEESMEQSDVPEEDVREQAMEPEEGCGMGCALVGIGMIALLAVLMPFIGMPIALGIAIVTLVFTLTRRRRKRRKG